MNREVARRVSNRVRLIAGLSGCTADTVQRVQRGEPIYDAFMEVAICHELDAEGIPRAADPRAAELHKQWSDR